MSTIIATAQPAKQSSLRALLARRPLLSYFVIAFAAVWLLLLPVVLARNGLGLLPFTVPDVAFILLFIGGTIAGPTAGALVVTAATEGKPGIRAFLRRYVQWRVGIQWYGLALFGPLVLFVLLASAFSGMAPLRDVAQNWLIIFTSYPILLLFMIVFPAMIEEPGWRGFALPHLQAKYGPLVATLFLGLLHGIWHLPVYFLVSGPAAMGPFSITFLVTNTINIMAITVFWSWVFNHARGSILIAILLHAANNATDKLLPDLVQHFPSNIVQIASGAYIVVALLIIVATRGRLGYKPEHVPVSAS